MKSAPTIRLATVADTASVMAVLAEATAWLEKEGMPMWMGDELSPERITHEITNGLFAVAEVEGETAGTVKFQLEDELFWPDQPRGEAAYVHRLAVKRAFAGGTISHALLAWAAVRARVLGRRYLRLDTDAARPRLRAIYERFGFQHHSDRQVGPYFVARYHLELSPLQSEAHEPGAAYPGK
jgi:GNAT superfamily N-acetyltransferase